MTTKRPLLNGKTINQNGEITFVIPDEEGQYRVFVYVHDNNNHVAGKYPISSNKIKKQIVSTKTIKK